MVHPFKRIGPAVAAVFFLAALALVLPPAASAQNGGMCDGQPPLVEGELANAIGILKELMALGPQLSADDEETIVRGHGLTSARMNCLLGKLMAGNDIFGWGDPGAYGVPLTREELDIIRQHQSDSLMLKKHLEENLNIKVEQ